MRVSHEQNPSDIRLETVVVARDENNDAGSSSNTLSSGRGDAPSRHLHTSSEDGVIRLPLSEREIPRWLRNDGRTKGIKILNWINGPAPRLLSIKPFFPKVQAFPARLVSKILPFSHGEFFLVLALVVIWIIAFTAITVSSLRAKRVDGFQSVAGLQCVASLWPDANTCGLNGTNCQPFDHSNFAFSCPAGCASASILNPHTVGDQEVNYRSYVIGGDTVEGNGTAALPVYRGDSFICSAALHAGVISQSSGGCGVLRRVGEQGNYTSITRNGITSIAFDPRFPFAFTLERGTNQCGDPQWQLFAVSAVITAFIAIFTTSPALFFVPVFLIAHFQIALASEPPFFSQYESAVSTAFARLIPSAAVAYIMYRVCVRRTLRDLGAPVEKAILWLGAFWVGALNRYTFDKLPISRLTGHDLRQQPGAITALVIILIVLLAAFIGQIWAFRTEGRLVRYLKLYICFGILLGLLAALPGLDLRLHHYIIAILLLPGTSIQTRPSLLYQGVLVGLFINGIARWNFDSIVQTPGALRGDAQLGSVLPYIPTPTFSNTSTSASTVASISFTIPDVIGGYDGLSMQVNDVQRFQISDLLDDFPAGGYVINYTRDTSDEPTFFRFAFTAGATFGGLAYGDYTPVGTWFANGSWGDVRNDPRRTGYPS